MSRRKRKKEKFMVPQPEHRRQERSQQWKNLGQVQADSAKRQGVKQQRKIPPRALAAIAIAVALLIGVGVPTYFYTASTAPVARHVPLK
jgi:hypothetical protein